MATANTMVPVAAQAPAVNTAAVLTLAAPTDGYWTVNSLFWSYDSAVANGSLTIAWTDPTAGAVSMVIYITAAGPGQLTFANPLKFPANTAVVITLAAGGAACTGKLYGDCQKH